MKNGRGLMNRRIFPDFPLKIGEFKHGTKPYCTAPGIFRGNFCPAAEQGVGFPGVSSR